MNSEDLAKLGEDLVTLEHTVRGYVISVTMEYPTGTAFIEQNKEGTLVVVGIEHHV